MKQIVFDDIKPGDILLTARVEKISRGIRFITAGDVSHAMICVGHGSVIDSTSDNVQARTLQREIFHDDEEVFHFRLKDAVALEVMSEIVDYARSQIGAPYSVKEAIRSVASIKKPRTKKQFCSRLVAQAYSHAGINLVSDADYCTPEDLRRSPALLEIATKTIALSDAEIAWRKSPDNPINLMHNSQNEILSAARSLDSSINTFQDLSLALLAKPSLDESISDAISKSGYLEVRQIDYKKNPWHYDITLFNKAVPSDQIEDMRRYFVGVVQQAYTAGLRFANNLIQYRQLNRQAPRKSFQLFEDLYEQLVMDDQIRREVAYNWLSHHYPRDLETHMEQICPHSPYWFNIIEYLEPNLAYLARHAVKSEGNSSVCSSCGDTPAQCYRLINGAKLLPGVPSLRLCKDCLAIRSLKGEGLMQFIRPEDCEDHDA